MHSTAKTVRRPRAVREACHISADSSRSSSRADTKSAPQPGVDRPADDGDGEERHERRRIVDDQKVELRQTAVFEGEDDAERQNRERERNREEPALEGQHTAGAM